MDEKRRSLFLKGLECHRDLTKEWHSHREEILKAINTLGIIVSKEEGAWRVWQNVNSSDKRKALKACKKLRKSINVLQKQLLEFMATSV